MEEVGFGGCVFHLPPPSLFLDVQKVGRHPH